MPVLDWFRPPRSLLTLYLVGAVTGVVCLTWLASRLLAQEQIVEAARVRAQLDEAANRAVAVSQRSLNDLGRLISAEDIPPPTGTVVIIADRTSIRARPPGRLVFVPVAPPAAEPPSDIFRAGEGAEFGTAGLTTAADVYRALAKTPSNAVRAGALVRLGRALRKSGHHAEALKVYSDLARLDEVVIEGRPAELFAREARCSTLDESHQSARLEQEANDLRRDLSIGRWAIAPALWEYLFAEASTWAGAAAPAIAGLDKAIALARATDVFWRQWRDQPLAEQLILPDESGPVLIVWKAASPGMRAVIAGPQHVEAIWRQMTSDPDVQIVLTDREGRPLLGRGAGTQVTRAPAETGLPWNIATTIAHPDRAITEASAHRRLLLAGLGIVGVLILGSSYFTFRGIKREMATARLQSDFVSAVSHEFRTPLTSLLQLSHMLHAGRIVNDDRRRDYYGVLVRESERLHRLVERLLTFGRGEANTEHYRFESVDAGDLALTMAADFRRHAGGWTVDLSTPPTPCRLRGDREMLSLALWNLLDNAMKYSPGCRTIWIDVSVNGAHAAIAVRDEGLGIAREDRQRIFRKFVRGRQDGTTAVHGTGIGLALVQQVVKAHGGQVRLDSEVGRGSTFTIVIPMETTA